MAHTDAIYSARVLCYIMWFALVIFKHSYNLVVAFSAGLGYLFGGGPNEKRLTSVYKASLSENEMQKV